MKRFAALTEPTGETIPDPYKKRRLPMANRKRNIQMKFYVTEEEKRLIDEKMAQLPTRRYGAYLRKMAIDGYNAAHFRPQVAFIRKAPSLPCGRLFFLLHSLYLFQIVRSVSSIYTFQFLHSRTLRAGDYGSGR